LECHYLDPQNQRRGKTPSSSLKAPEIENPVTHYVNVDADNSPLPAFGLEGDESTAVIDQNTAISWSTSNAYTPTSNMSTASPASDLSFSCLSVAPSLVQDVDKSLLNHYVKVVAVVLSRKSDQRVNPFLTNVLPVALSNKLVMDAVLALSASHWKKLQPRLWKRGMLHQTNTLQSLAKLLPHIPFKSMQENEFAPTLNWARLAWFDKLKWSSLSSDAGIQQKQRQRIGWVKNLFDAPNFANLPRTLIFTAGADPLRDEGEAYAMKLIEHGNDVVVKRFLGVPHPFMKMDGALVQGELFINMTCREIRMCHE
jgi:hypothetical protein